MGKYFNYDMSALNLRYARDYALYLALTSSDQGIGHQVIRARMAINK